MSKRPPKIKATVQALVEVEDVVDNMNQQEIYRFIVALDAGVQDWDFTLRLYEHFNKLKAQWKREVALDSRTPEGSKS